MNTEEIIPNISVPAEEQWRKIQKAKTLGLKECIIDKGDEVSNEFKKSKNIIMLTYDIPLHIQKEFQIEAILPRVNKEHPHVDSWKDSTTRHPNLPKNSLHDIWQKLKQD